MRRRAGWPSRARNGSSQVWRARVQSPDPPMVTSPAQSLSRRRNPSQTRSPQPAKVGLALQLQFDVGSDSMPHHDWGIMDGGWIGRGDVGAVGVVVAGGQGADQAVVPAGAEGGLRRGVL